MNTVGVGSNYAPFVVALLLFLQILALKSVLCSFCWTTGKSSEPEIVGPTKGEKSLLQ